mgnify:CR=1
MYQTALNFGLLPDQFWDMTLREFIWYRNGYLERLSREWDRTSSVMALFANANAAKGKKYSPEDFHPFSQMKRSQGQVSSKEEADALLEKMKNF